MNRGCFTAFYQAQITYIVITVLMNLKQCSWTAKTHKKTYNVITLLMICTMEWKGVQTSKILTLL